MARNATRTRFRHEDVSSVPSGWHVRTISHGRHRIRVAFPPGRRRTGAGRLVSILHPAGENPHTGCLTSSQLRNPAELVLMGANPAKGFAIRWRTGRLSQPFESEEKAKHLLKQFGGKGEVVRLSAQNPAFSEAEEAREIYAGFHASESQRHTVMEEPHIPSGDYAQLGKLLKLVIKPERGGQVMEIILGKENVLVLSDASRRQIYFAGGDQSLSEKELHTFTDDNENVVELGELRQIVYVARKYHEEVEEFYRGKEIEWFHNLGEETGIRPHLFYDRAEERFLLRGGEYVVKDPGIVN